MIRVLLCLIGLWCAYSYLCGDAAMLAWVVLCGVAVGLDVVVRRRG